MSCTACHFLYIRKCCTHALLTQIARNRILKKKTKKIKEKKKKNINKREPDPDPDPDPDPESAYNCHPQKALDLLSSSG